MTARQQLSALYDQWHRLTRAETAAIEAEQWAELEKHQREKNELQSGILFWSGQLPENSAAGDHLNAQFRSVVQELLCLERENGRLLTARMQEAQRKRAALEQTARAASRQRKLASAPESSAWEAYS